MELSSGAARTASTAGGGCGGGGGGREAQANMEKTDRERDCHEWKLTTVDPQERSTWRSGVRSAMRAAQPVTWKGAH